MPADDRPDWYKDAIFYELRVRSFFDADGDGIGDFRGLLEKLDYVRDLGVTTLWLLPFYPSPLRDDGYDIADYATVHPAVGTLDDFRAFLDAAHARELKVVTELVLNHSSDQHAWFQRARRAPKGSRFRDFYVWNDDPRRYPEARIIFQDFESSNWSWDPVAESYYWHRFFSHQPDLNFESADVQAAMLELVDHWFGMGVDGLRLDAVPYLFERDGTNCENLPETHDFLRKLRAHVDARFPARMLLAEANQWPEDAAAYFGSGDECHMAFHFPIMPRLFMALHLEDRFPIVDILEQTPLIPPTCQWALFLRNHDELTLEMVTDEERDYMLSAYAREPRARINLGIRRRLAPLLDNNRRRIELMKALLFSLPGTPVIYYGDEIGMGDNVFLGDRDGVRTPMQWSPDRNAGFSRANPQRLILPTILDPEYHFEAVNVETQQGNLSSLLWWTKRIIALRKQHPAFGRGTLEPLTPRNRKILAFLRRYETEVLLVVVNLSRFAQHVELDLGEFRGRSLVELFGCTRFPSVGEQPYSLMLGPHNFYWFALESPSLEATLASVSERDVPTLEVAASFTELLDSPDRIELEPALLRYMTTRRWFRGKARRAQSARIIESLRMPERAALTRLLLVEIAYSEGPSETYSLLVRYQPGTTLPEEAIALVRRRDGLAEDQGVLVEAAADPDVALALVELVLDKQQIAGEGLVLRGVPFGELVPEESALPAARVIGAEQSNTSWCFGDRFVAKLLRRVDKGQSLELEVLSELQRQGFIHAPKLVGHLELSTAREEPWTLLVLESFIPNEGGAWSFTIDEIERYFERVLAERGAAGPPVAPSGMLARARQSPPAVAVDGFANYLDVAQRLGRRTAEMHVALAAGVEQPAFLPEPFTSLAQRAFYQSLRNLSSKVLDSLRERRLLSTDPANDHIDELIGSERELQSRIRRVLERKLGGQRIRCHGDYHLGQVLHTGRDFMIIDFEGEPLRTLAERRRKRSPLADVAGMLRSFHYALYAALGGHGASVRPDDVALLEPWAELWYAWVSAAFLGSYLDGIAATNLVPSGSEELELLLDAYLLEKALYEVAYEQNHRPAWLSIPLRGVLDVLEGK